MRVIQGQPFSEQFNFKDESGRSVNLPPGKFKVVLERGGFVKEYIPRSTKGGVEWILTSDDTKDFNFSTGYYILYLDDKELSRGTINIERGA